MPWMNQNAPTLSERIIGGLCYLTFGLAGLLYIIIAGRSNQTSFFRFHFLQSIILGILGLLFSWASNIFISLLLAGLHLLGPALAMQTSGVVILSISVIGKAAYLLLFYGMIWAFLGKYAEIPFVSPLVYQQMR